MLFKIGRWLLVMSLCLAARPALVQTQNDQSWDGLTVAGQAALQKGDYVDAQRKFEAALRLAEQFSPQDPRLGKSLNDLAAVYYAQQDFARAEPLLERSLAAIEQALGPDDPDVAQSLKNLAALHYLQGDYDEAEPLLQRSLIIWEEALGPEHPYVATVLSNLGGLYQAQNRYDEAEPLLERSLAIWEKQLGPDHPAVAQSRQLLEQLAAARSAAERGDTPPQLAAPSAAPSLSDAEALSALAEAAEQVESRAPADSDAPIAPETPATPEPSTDAAADTDGDAEAATDAVTADETATAPTTVARVESAVDAAARAATGTTALEGDVPPAIHLSSLWSLEAAEQDWARLQARFPDLLGDRQLQVQRLPLDAGGTFFRVLAGPFTDQPTATSLCQRLKARTQYCAVVQP